MGFSFRNSDTYIDKLLLQVLLKSILSFKTLEGSEGIKSQWFWSFSMYSDFSHIDGWNFFFIKSDY